MIVSTSGRKPLGMEMDCRDVGIAQYQEVRLYATAQPFADPIVVCWRQQAWTLG